ncbi:MAG: MOSC domain-containing protein, partial [Actinomycetota bacterium]
KTSTKTSTWRGSVLSIHIAAVGCGPMLSVAEARAIPGKGLEGDRYFLGTGSFSNRPRPGREITLIETEALQALARDCSIRLEPSQARRNLVTTDVPLNHLVGEEFRVGDVTLMGVRLCEPCRLLEELVGRKVRPGLVHRGGLRAAILTEGTLRQGDRVHPI